MVGLHMRICYFLTPIRLKRDLIGRNMIALGSKRGHRI